MDIYGYWEAVLSQDAIKMKSYFQDNAYVNWHDSNEHFTLEEFILANCEYPGAWNGAVERVEKAGNLLITATHVYTEDMSLSFHVVSFIKVLDNKICSIDEYWGQDEAIPQWRLDKHIGTAIK